MGVRSRGGQWGSGVGVDSGVRSRVDSGVRSRGGQWGSGVGVDSGGQE